MTINGNLKGIKSLAMHSSKKFNSFSNNLHFKKIPFIFKSTLVNNEVVKIYTNLYCCCIDYVFILQFGTTLIIQINAFTLVRKIRPAKKPIGPENIGIAGSQKTVTGRGSSHISMYKGV